MKESDTESAKQNQKSTSVLLAANIVRPKLIDNESAFVKQMKERAIRESESKVSLQVAILADKVLDLIKIIENHCDHSVST